MAMPRLFELALNRDFDGVQAEIDNGANVSQRYNGFGILHLLPWSGGFYRAGGYPHGTTREQAIEMLGTETTQMYSKLIDAGVDVNAVDGWQRNALFYPCKYADTKGPRGHKFSTTVDVVIAAGGNPNAPDKWGQTPATAAIWSGDLDVVQAVFDDGGADVNLQTDYRGFTPFIVSVRAGNIDIVNYILTLNPDVSKRESWHNKTAKDFAYDQRRQDIVEAIETFGEMTGDRGDNDPSDE